MSDTTNTIERAFEIAKSGSCQTVEQIVSQLNREQFDGAAQHLKGPSIRKQLHALMKAAA